MEGSCRAVGLGGPRRRQGRGAEVPHPQPPRQLPWSLQAGRRRCVRRGRQGPAA
uniref:Uncharacterized protein n=1 Tax=Arundo donax TaxID=35708 RepID=A0A0A9A8D9_ARUDO